LLLKKKIQENKDNMVYINPKKKYLASIIKIDGVSEQEIYNLLMPPQDVNLADLCLPCFKFAGFLKKSPKVIAEELATQLAVDSGQLTVEAVNGYLNFKFNTLQTAKNVIAEVVKRGADYGACNVGGGDTVCIDFSSVNIAKPFHIGHLSTTVIGGALYRIYKKMGYNAVSINHLGDWGTQFGKLIAAFKMWGERAKLNAGGIDYLTELYVKFHKEAEANESLNDDARRYFKQLENGDAEAQELFLLFKEITLTKVKEIYDELDIKFDSYHGEAFFNDKMAPVFEDLEAKNLIKVSDGAKIVDLDEFNMPPLLLMKADGATLYATRDLAAAYYRKKTYNFVKCLYVVAYQQNLHFKQVFKTLELLKKDWAKDMVHVPFGMVSLESGAMSTRQGNVVKLKDVFLAAVEKSLAIIEEKNPNLKNKQEVSKQVGVGAVVFSALVNNRIKDIVFSYDKILNFDGETAPYIQYTSARALSVLRNAKEVDSGQLAVGSWLPSHISHLTSEELKGLDNKESEILINLIEKLPSVLCDCLDKHEPSLLTRHIIDIAKAFNKFYYEHRILNADEQFKKARLALVYCTHTVIKEGLRLLGIQTPNEM
jgi:arginyl-tRNA synthetase